MKYRPSEMTVGENVPMHGSDCSSPLKLREILSRDDSDIEAVSSLQNPLRIKHNRLTRLDNKSGDAVFVHQFDRSHTDSGKVDPEVLDRFSELHQNAALSANSRRAFNGCVRALNRLYGDDGLVSHHDRLPDIEGARRPSGLPPYLGVLYLITGQAPLRQRSRFRNTLLKERASSDDLDPAVLNRGDNPAHNRVIVKGPKLRQHPQTDPIDAETVNEIDPCHPARKGDLSTTRPFQGPDKLSKLAHGNPGRALRERFNPFIRLPFDRDGHHGEPPRSGVFGELDWKLAITGDKTDRGVELWTELLDCVHACRKR
jgi:hypothetical protein